MCLWSEHLAHRNRLVSSGANLRNSPLCFPTASSTESGSKVAEMQERPQHYDPEPQPPGRQEGYQRGASIREDVMWRL
ncbi:putative nuclease HARBI1 [Tachysurus ichikawai]